MQQPPSVQPKHKDKEGRDKSNPLDSFERRVTRTINLLQKISMTAFDYQADSGPVLQRRINELVGLLEDVESASSKIDRQVPMRAIEFIEEGGNPDVYTKEIAQLLTDKNQKTNGRIKSIKGLHDALGKEVEINYPELWHEYTNLLSSMEANDEGQPISSKTDQ